MIVDLNVQQVRLLVDDMVFGIMDTKDTLASLDTLTEQDRALELSRIEMRNELIEQFNQLVNIQLTK